MNIQSLNNYYTNFSNINNKTNENHYSFKTNTAVDTVSFSGKKRNLETMSDTQTLIRQAKYKGFPRFTLKEQDMLIKELDNFAPKAPKETMEKLLNMKYPNGQVLSLVDIANFLNTTHTLSAQTQSAVLEIMEYELNHNLISTSDTLDSFIYLPIENKPVLGKGLAAIYKEYSANMPVETRSSMLSSTLQIAQNLENPNSKIMKQIADKLTKSDNIGFVYTTLSTAADLYSQKDFEKVLKAMNDKEIQKGNEYYNNATNGFEEENYTTSFIKKTIKK